MDEISTFFARIDPPAAGLLHFQLPGTPGAARNAFRPATLKQKHLFRPAHLPPILGQLGAAPLPR